MGCGQVVAVAVLALLGPCPPVPPVPPPDQYANRILRRKQTLHAGQVLPSAAARGGGAEQHGCPEPETCTLALPHARCAHTLNVLRGGREASSGPPRLLSGGVLGAYPLKPRGDAEILDQVQEVLLRRRDGQRSPSPPIFTWSSAAESLEGAERPTVSAREAYAKSFRFDRCACACDVRVRVLVAYVYRRANPCPPARAAHFQPRTIRE